MNSWLQRINWISKSDSNKSGKSKRDRFTAKNRRRSLIESLEDRRVLASLALVDFETNAGYTTSVAEFTASGGTDYFIRTDGSDISGEVFNNIQGSFYFAVQDTDGGPGAVDNLTLDMNQIDISSVTGNLAFSVFIAEDQAGDGNEDWDPDTSVRFAYSIDGGAFQNLIAVEATGGTNTEPAIDTNFDGVGDGATITDTFTQYTASIPGLGSTLNIRVFFDILDAGDEDIAIDNLEVTGDTGGPIPTNLVVAAGPGAVQLEGDSGNTAFTFTVNRSGDTSGATDVNWAVTSSEADAADFGGILPSGTVSFLAGETQATISINVSGDTAVETDEDFTVTLSNATGGANITGPTATGNILNDDFAGLVAPYSNDFETVAGAAGLGAGWTTFSVDADAANTWFPSTAASDRFAEVNAFGDTVPAEDWLISPPFDLTASSSEIITFETWTQFVDPGIANPQVKFLVSTDYSGVGTPSAATWNELTYTAAAENSQVFTPSGNVDVSSINGNLVWFAFQYTSSGTSGSDTTRWRVDDFQIQTAASIPDFAIAATDASKAEGNAGTTNFTFTVTRSGSTVGGDTVDYTIAGATANPADATDFTSLLTGTVTFLDGEAAKVITLQVTGDTTQEPNEGFTVTLSNPSRSGTLSQPSASGTIVDDDAPAPTVWINEFHYDDDAGDLNEFVEVAGTAGADLTGWSIIHYNGNGGGIISTIALGGIIDDEGGTGFGALDFTGEPAGFQNGNDGFALVNAQGVVVEFISYEGTFDATAGAAIGLSAVDVGAGIEETNTTPQGFSLQRNNSVPSTPGAWFGPADDSPGTLNITPVQDITLDTEDTGSTTLVGGWGISTSVPGFEGANYAFARPGTNSTATFTPTIPTDGQYEVFVNYSAHPNRASNAGLRVFHNSGVFVTTLNQQTGGGTFNSVGTFNFVAGSFDRVVISAAGSDGIVTADAVRFVRVGELVTPPSAQLSSPSNNEVLTADALNTQGYLEFIFSPTVSIDSGSVNDAPPEFTLSGPGVSNVVIDDSNVQNIGNGTFRYNFTGSFVPGQVFVNFIAGTFVDSAQPGVPNLATQQSFTLTDNVVRITLDNTDATQVNSWSSSGAVPGYLGPDYLFNYAGGAGRLTFTPNIPTDGEYEVFVNYTGGATRATNAAYEVVSQSGTSVIRVDQRAGGGSFQSIGTFNFIAGTSGSVTLRASDADGVVVGDAVRFVRVDDLSGAPTATLADPLAGATIVVTTINGNDFIDVTFADTSGAGLNLGTITDSGAEFTLSGPGATGVTVNGAATLVSGTTYRYATTGDFNPGAVDAVFAAGTFADSVGNQNLDTIASFVIGEDVLEEIIVDNTSFGFSVNDPNNQFVTSSGVGGFIGTNYLAAATGSTATATWTPTITTNGQYEVFVRFTSHPLRATNANYTVSHDGGTTPMSIDQRTGGGSWVSLGTFNLSSGAFVMLDSAGANQFVIADAVRFVRL